MLPLHVFLGIERGQVLGVPSYSTVSGMVTFESLMEAAVVPEQEAG